MNRYQIFDIEGILVNEGDLSTINDIDVPTHGSISFQLSNDVWLNFLTSEWLMVSLTQQPRTWRKG